MVKLRAYILWNSFRLSPAAGLVGLAFALGLGYLAWAGTSWFLDFLASFPLAGNVVAERTLGSLLLVLASAELLTAIPNAVAVLYASEDLPLLLSLPQRAARVFLFKVSEVFVTTALFPALLTLPVLFAYGHHYGAPWFFYPLAVLITFALYAFPVALGVGLALPLVRFAPAGRAREWAAAAGAVMGGVLIYLLRALKPEALLKTDFENPEALDKFLETFRNPVGPLLPSGWAHSALEGLIDGKLLPEFWYTLLLSATFLVLAGLVAGYAYQVGWVRALEGAVAERGMVALGFLDQLTQTSTALALWVRDLRLFFRDANHAAQLVLVGVLVLLYTTSLQYMPLEGNRFKLVVGFMHLAFQGFVIAGVGVRLAYPLYSLEGAGFWIVQTAPVSKTTILLTRFGLALLFLLPLGLLLGGLSPSVIGLGPSLSQISLLLGASAAVAAAGLGVGLGAAFPRFEASNPAEIPIGLGGFLYMALTLLHAGGLVVLASRPVFLSFTQPGLDYLSSLEGALWLSVLALATVIPAALALSFGHRRMASS